MYFIVPKLIKDALLKKILYEQETRNFNYYVTVIKRDATCG
jgi:hypothetical protein